MSLLLSSLKKADQENKKSADEAQTSPLQTAIPAAGSVPAPAAPVSPAPVDLDAMSESDAPPVPSASLTSGFTPTSARTGGAGVKSAKEQAKELVAATRVFRASGGDEKRTSPVLKMVYAILGMAAVVGSGYAVVISGLVPGVSLTSVMSLLGIQERAVVQSIPRGPELEALGADDVVLSLPIPLVDVQADVDFAGLQVPEEDLQTAEGRRQYQERIAIIAGIVTPAEVAAEEEDLITPDFPELGGGSGGIDVELLGEVKTASASRHRKAILDARTLSDRVLDGAIKVNKQEADAEAVMEKEPSETLTGALVAQAEDVGAAGEESGGATTAAQTKTKDDNSGRVGTSLSGKEREVLLQQASDFYAAGSFAEAEAIYRNILAKNSINIDAMRGLAIVAVATGRYQLAVATYLRVLESYPNDPVAIADLANLHGVSSENFYSLEAALQAAIGKQPDWDSRLYFALGNLYAGQARWSDAQKSYFQAYSAEQSNPDYAYNLAVVLDYLNKPTLAVKYYREAVSSSERSPSGFNVRDVEERIRSITK